MTTKTVTTTKWNIDKVHSTIEFKVKHLMITTVTGLLKDYELTVETEEDDFTTAKVTFTADTASINTGSEDRDTHLKGEDFFNVVKFPKLIFVSADVEKKNDQNYIMRGNLTIRDITKPISLNVEYGGQAKDPWGGNRAGFNVTGKINRKDFDLIWNVLLESGGMLVGDEVAIQCNVQLVKS